MSTHDTTPNTTEATQPHVADNPAGALFPAPRGSWDWDAQRRYAAIAEEAISRYLDARDTFGVSAETAAYDVPLAMAFNSEWDGDEVDNLDPARYEDISRAVIQRYRSLLRLGHDDPTARRDAAHAAPEAAIEADTWDADETYADTASAAASPVATRGGETLTDPPPDSSGYEFDRWPAAESHADTAYTSGPIAPAPSGAGDPWRPPPSPAHDAAEAEQRHAHAAARTTQPAAEAAHDVAAHLGDAALQGDSASASALQAVEVDNLLRAADEGAPRHWVRLGWPDGTVRFLSVRAPDAEAAVTTAQAMFPGATVHDRHRDEPPEAGTSGADQPLPAPTGRDAAAPIPVSGEPDTAPRVMLDELDEAYDVAAHLERQLAFADGPDDPAHAEARRATDTHNRLAAAYEAAPAQRVRVSWPNGRARFATVRGWDREHALFNARYEWVHAAVGMNPAGHVEYCGPNQPPPIPVPAAATEPCARDGCSGALAPVGVPHADEGDGAAMIDTHCQDCGLQSVYSWTLPEADYHAQFGHTVDDQVGSDDPDAGPDGWAADYVASDVAGLDRTERRELGVPVHEALAAEPIHAPGGEPGPDAAGRRTAAEPAIAVPEAAGRPCPSDGCSGAMGPVGPVATLETEGAAQVCIRCPDCGTGSVHNWTLTDGEYHAQFGHPRPDPEPQHWVRVTDDEGTTTEPVPGRDADAAMREAREIWPGATLHYLHPDDDPPDANAAGTDPPPTPTTPTGPNADAATPVRDEPANQRPPAPADEPSAAAAALDEVQPPGGFSPDAQRWSPADDAARDRDQADAILAEVPAAEAAATRAALDPLVARVGPCLTAEERESVGVTREEMSRMSRYEWAAGLNPDARPAEGDGLAVDLDDEAEAMGAGRDAWRPATASPHQPNTRQPRAAEPGAEPDAGEDDGAARLDAALRRAEQSLSVADAAIAGFRQRTADDARSREPHAAGLAAEHDEPTEHAEPDEYAEPAQCGGELAGAAR